MAGAKEGVQRIAIPNIQRPYVWKPSQLAKLVDSLMHGWPCGNLLLWDVQEQSQQVFAMREFDFGFQPDADARVISNVDNYQYLILDGQQRIQSLIIALDPASRGYTNLEKNWVIDGNPKSERKQLETVTRYLCFDLTNYDANWLERSKINQTSYFYLDHDEDVCQPHLVWKCLDEIDGRSIIRLSEVVAGRYPDTDAGKWLHQEIQQLLHVLPIPTMCVNKGSMGNSVILDDDEAVVQMFTRLNTAGTPLTKEQILSAKVNSLWSEFPERIEQMQNELLKVPFRYVLDADDIVKGFNIVLQVKHSAKMYEAYKRESDLGTDAWEKDWNRFRTATRLVFETLQSKGIYYKSEYQSLYVVWFSVAALFKCGLENENELDDALANMIVKYSLVSSWARIWANRSGQFVKFYTDSLMKFGEHEAVDWFRIQLRDAKLIKPAKDAIETLAVNHRGSVRQYYQFLWVWSRMNEERSKLLALFAENDDSFDVDHIVPISWIENYDQKATFNSLGNCWLLASAANGAKSDDAMRDFLKGENIDMSISDLEIPLDCKSVHLSYMRGHDDISVVMNAIAERTTRMKSELIHYVETENVKLFYPGVNARAIRDGVMGTYGIYREDEFKSSPYFRVSLGTAKQYLRGIKTIISKLGLSDNDLSGCQNNLELKQQWQQAAVVERANSSYLTGWNKYLNFLFNSSDGAQRTTRMNIVEQDDIFDDVVQRIVSSLQANDSIDICREACEYGVRVMPNYANMLKERDRMGEYRIKSEFVRAFEFNPFEIRRSTLRTRIEHIHKLLGRGAVIPQSFSAYSRSKSNGAPRAFLNNAYITLLDGIECRLRNV